MPPIPVVIPEGPLVITQDDVTRAEAFVESIGRILQYGTTGASPGAPAMLVPDGPDSSVSPDFSSAAIQLFYRQLGIAVARVLVGGSGSSDPIEQPQTFTGICTESAAIGDVVSVVSAFKSVAKTDIAQSPYTPAVGIIVSKPTPAQCVVRVAGLMENIASGLIPGSLVFVSDSGRPTCTVPLVGATPIHQQVIGVAVDTNLMLVSPALVVVRRTP